MIRRFVVREAYTKNSTFSTMRSQDGRMRKLFAVRPPRFWIIATVGILVLCAAYSCFIDSQKPLAPPVPVVSACQELTPGRTRRWEQHRIDFHVTAEDF